MENENNVSYQEANYSAADPNKSVMTMGEWLITFLVMMVPCVNIIMVFVWAFGNGNENRKNYCRAFLIMSVITTVLVVILYVTLIASFLASYV